MLRLATLLVLSATVALAPPAFAQVVEAYDATEEAGILETSRTWGASVVDFDLDGWHDVLISRHYGNDARLYRSNQAGRFEEVQAGTFGPADRHGCAWGDVNADGLPDAFCALGGKRGVEQSDPDELWIQQADGTFVDQHEQYGLDGSYDRGRYATFIDVNHDPYPDLYVGNGYPRADGQPSLNRLFINSEGMAFREAPEYGLQGQVGAESVQAVDYDADGWQDLLVCGQNGWIRLYRNLAGRRFEDVSVKTGARRPCRAALLVDVDGDLRPDLARVALRRVTVTLQSGGEFSSRVESRSIDHGHHLAAGDVDGDSDQDLYVLRSGPRDDASVPDERDLMLQNRDGLDFTRMPIPQTTAGRGDAVVAIDHDRNGLIDFLVLNGAGPIEGPIRLVAFREDGAAR